MPVKYTQCHTHTQSQVSCVEMIVDKQSGGGGDLCTQPDSSGATPAHYAAMNGREDILSILKAKVESPPSLQLTIRNCF